MRASPLGYTDFIFCFSNHILENGILHRTACTHKRLGDRSHNRGVKMPVLARYVRIRISCLTGFPRRTSGYQTGPLLRGRSSFDFQRADPLMDRMNYANIELKVLTFQSSTANISYTIVSPSFRILEAARCAAGSFSQNIYVLLKTGLSYRYFYRLNICCNDFSQYV